MGRLSWTKILVAIFVSVFCASLVFQLFFIIPHIQDAEAQAAQSRQTEVIRRIGRELNGDLTRARDGLTRMARRPEFRNMDVGSQHSTMIQHIEVSQFADSLYVMDGQGWFVSGTVEDLSVYRDKSYADQPFFSVPFEQGEIHFSPPRFYSHSEIVATSISAPIESDTGHRVGVLIGGIRLNELIDLVADYPPGDGGIAFVVDREGTVVAHSGIDLFALEEGPLSLDYQDQPLVRAIMEGEKGASGEYDPEGAPCLRSYALVESNGWGVVVETPWDAILAGSSALTWRLSINVALLVIALAASFVFTRQTTAERRQAEEALQRSEERYRAVVEDQTEMICRHLPDGTITFVNEAYCRNAAKKREELVGYSYRDRISRENIKIVQEHLASLTAENPFATHQRRVVKPDGVVRWQQWTIRAILDDQGNTVEYQSIGQDVTDRVLAEQALRESEERFRQMADVIPAIFWMFSDDNRQARYISPAYEKVYGRSRKSAHEDPQSWLDAIHPEDRERVIAFDEEHRGEEHEMEYRIVRPDGSVRWLHDRVIPVRDECGDVMHIVGFSEDITERVRVEEQMRHQEQMAALGQLAGGIAHDFNNILTGIVLSTQMALGEPDLPKTLVSDLKDVIADVRRGAHLIRQITDFSRRSFFETSLQDLRVLIEDCAESLGRTLPDNIRIVLDVGRDECAARVDGSRVKQVVLNLALNARDAMPEGGELRIRLSRVVVKPGTEPPVEGMSSGEWVCLVVSDTGSGMPPEVTAHLFEPFFTTKPSGQGTGMGLAQVHGIVKQHNGYIGVETEPGRGTTIRVYLPAEKAEAKAKGAQREEPAAIAPDAERNTILLVEDEDRVRRLARKALESLGYDVLTAADGREALKVYRSSERVDLVLTDMVMPEMGGRELVQKLRKRNPHLRALVMTGYALENDLQELMDEGILGVVHKPFDLSTLASTIKDALQVKRV